MKIIFFGEDSFSNIVLQSLIAKGHDVQLVVCPLYDNNIHKRLENTCIQNEIKWLRVSKLEDADFVDRLKAIAPDLMVITHFERLLKKTIIKINVGNL